MGCHLELPLHLGAPLAWPMAKGKQESETTQWIEKARDHRIHRPTQNFAYYGDKNVKNWIGLVQSQALGAFGLRNTWGQNADSYSYFLCDLGSVISLY